MKLDHDDQDTIVAYTLSRARVPNSGALYIHHLAKLRCMHMKKSIAIATQELARIQIDSLYWK